jgi:hypothetical protein
MLDQALHRVTAGLVRRTWLVALVTVLVCTVCAAHAIAALVDASYLDSAPPRVPLVRVQNDAPALTTRMTPDGAALVTRNMFCSTCTPIVGGGPGPTDAFTPEALLIATSIGRAPVATIRVPKSEVQGSWEVGDTIPGIGTITSIGFVTVELVDDRGRHGTLSLLDSQPGGRGDGGAATPTPAAADPFADRVKKIDDTTYEVDRSLIRDLVGGTMKTGGARIMPVTTKDGKLDGLRLFGVRPGSVAAAVGLQNTDTIEAVNNIKIESANTMLDLLAKLDSLTTVELAGKRRGKPLTLTLRLR